MLGLTAADWTAIGTWATVVVLLTTALAAFLQLREQFRPWVTVDFHFRSNIAFIAVKNIGNRPAYDIRLRFEPELVSTLDRVRFNEVAMIRDRIPVLVPGQARMTLFDRVSDRLRVAKLPESHRVFVDYRSHRERSYGPYEFVLDFASLDGATLPDKNVNDLVGAVERLGNK